MHEDRTIDSNVNVMSDVHALIPFSSIPLGDVMFSSIYSLIHLIFFLGFYSFFHLSQTLAINFSCDDSVKLSVIVSICYVTFGAEIYSNSI